MAAKYFSELIKVLPEPEKIKNNKVEGNKITSLNDSSAIMWWLTDQVQRMNKK